jgi:Transposase Tn5 dimerisation domain
MDGLVSFVNKSHVPPTAPPTMREAMRIVAGLGGFLGRKGDGEPGTQTLWLGLQRLDDLTWSWCAFSPFAKDVPVPSNGTYG